jgi:hypothetical protein
MSQAATSTTSESVQAVFRYGEPDRSVPASARSLFSQPKLVNMHEAQLPLHNYRTATHLTRGVEGLHRHGFTLLENHVDPGMYATEQDVRESYIPYVEKLVRELTGCKTAIVNNAAFRRKVAEKYDKDKAFYHPKGGEIDRMMAAFPSDVAMSMSVFPLCLWSTFPFPDEVVGLRAGARTWSFTYLIGFTQSRPNKPTVPSNPPAACTSTTPCKVCSTQSGTAAPTWHPRAQKPLLQSTPPSAHPGSRRSASGGHSSG